MSCKGLSVPLILDSNLITSPYYQGVKHCSCVKSSNSFSDFVLLNMSNLTKNLTNEWIHCIIYIHCHIILLTHLSGLGSYKSASRKWKNLWRANLMEAQHKVRKQWWPKVGKQWWPKVEGVANFFKILVQSKCPGIFYMVRSIILGYWLFSQLQLQLQQTQLSKTIENLNLKETLSEKALISTSLAIIRH